MASKKKSARQRAARAAAAGKRASTPVHLNAEQERVYRSFSNAAFDERKRRPLRMARAGLAAPRQFVVVAEGDSWFDYKPSYLELGGKDLLGHLQTSGRINVYRVSKAGDTLENAFRYGIAAGSSALMSPGTELSKPADVDRLLPQIRVEEIK